MHTQITPRRLNGKVVIAYFLILLSTWRMLVPLWGCNSTVKLKHCFPAPQDRAAATDNIKFVTQKGVLRLALCSASATRGSL